ncbi:hypothetical protein G6F59_018953 [Rhizopus arrhizus]|nr:hypothetical protein G6F59_018953 [Rhizopus arrhizus]
MGIQDDFRVHQQAAAVAGQRERMRVAQEQAAVARLLQLPDVVAYRGLGQPQPPGGLGEAGRGRGGGKGLEPQGIEHGAVWS